MRDGIFHPIKKLKFNRKNISKIPSKSGVYEFYSKDGKLLYVGVATKGRYSNLKHRIESYEEKDDFDTHPTKKERISNIDKHK